MLGERLGEIEAEGDCEGLIDGERLGEKLGDKLGLNDALGLTLAEIEGDKDGDILALGLCDGEIEGLKDGDSEGLIEGDKDADAAAWASSAPIVKNVLVSLKFLYSVDTQVDACASQDKRTSSILPFHSLSVLVLSEAVYEPILNGLLD